MNFLNLGIGEFLGLFGAISGALVVLYLLDRSKKRLRVSTLRFWVNAEQPLEQQHRRRIQQPWSLLLQILSILLLLLAIAQVRFGSMMDTARDHVLLLDTSAWMAARSGERTLLDESRAAALAYLRSLPAGDRLMVVRADAMATPATGFSEDRGVLETAIRSSEASSSGLRLDAAFAFAKKAQQLHARNPGEIVFAGAGRMAAADGETQAPEQLRILPVRAKVENVGLRKVGLKRSQDDPEVWEILATARNYGSAPRNVTLALQFGGAPVGSAVLSIAPGAEQDASFRFRTKAAGWLETRILAKDGFAQDDRAVVELPARSTMRVAVYSDRPELLRPLFDNNARIEVAYRGAAQYTGDPGADLLILDGFAPVAAPRSPTLWIEPPAGRPPLPVLRTVTNAQIERWHAENPLGQGLRTTDVRVESTQVYRPGSQDLPVLEVEGGAAIVARPARDGAGKMVVMGFHPGKSALKFELATPLLFANVMRWMSPDVFRRVEVQASSVGSMTVPLDPGRDPEEPLQVVTADHQPLPYTTDNSRLVFYSGSPGTVRVIAGDRETVYSQTLPEVGDTQWVAPASVRRGIPRGFERPPAPREWWPWLASLGALGLLADWMLYGRSQRLRFGRPQPRAKARVLPWRKAS